MENLEKKLCVSIGDKDVTKCVSAAKMSEFAELRGDICALSTKDVEDIVSYNPNLVFTYRLSEDNAKIAEQQLLAAVNKGVSYIDIEHTAPDSLIKKVHTAIIKKLEIGRTKLIISFHDFKGTPSLKELLEIAKMCKKRGADIVKIVTTARNLSEASRVMQLYHAPDLPVKKSELVAFAMGENAQFTRIASLYLGAPYTYCAATNPTAIGQLSAGQMLREFSTDAFKFRTPEKSDSDLFAKYGTSLLHKKDKAYNRSVHIPCSKSVAQRAILCAAIAIGKSVLRNFEPCEDIKAAIAFAKQVGCQVKATRGGLNNREEKSLIIKSPGVAKWKNLRSVDVEESGLLARLLLPLLTAVAGVKKNKIAINGTGSLTKRDLSSAVEAIQNGGGVCESSAKKALKGAFLPITVSKGFSKKNFAISGKESSQTVSGMLMTMPLLGNDTRLTVENPTSIPYIDLTLNVLEAFGVKMSVKRMKDKFVFDIPSKQVFTAADYFMDSDWSSAANFVVAGVIASRIDNCAIPSTFTIKNMNVATKQADEKVLEIAALAGATVSYEPSASLPDLLSNVIVSAKELKGFETDLTNSPDLFPILVTLAVFCHGVSKIKGVERLFKKESNRAESLLMEFARLGYNVGIEGNTMIIKGDGGRMCNTSIKEAFCSSHNDHRIAMAVIVAALFRKFFNPECGEVWLDDVQCIDKSFPTFLEKLLLKKEEEAV